jgi:hypothetical protein
MQEFLIYYIVNHKIESSFSPYTLLLSQNEIHEKLRNIIIIIIIIIIQIAELC